MISITPDPLAPGQLFDAFLAGLKRDGLHDVGATVIFTGRARQTEQRKAIDYLYLEHYPGMSERVMTRAAISAKEQFGLAAVSVIHRVGKITPGEVIIVLLAAAPHRRAAFAGAQWLMDWLKAEAPFWKYARTKEGEKIWIAAKEADRTPPANDCPA